MARAYFNETQRFRQWWIFLIILLVIISWAYSLITSLQAKEADKATDDLVLIFLSVIPVLLILLMISLRLVTRIRNDGIHIQFKPLQWKEKHIKPEDIQSYEVRKYKPIAEYGGWGIRAGLRRSGKAYNVSGNIGLQLYLKNGRKLLIGTKKSREIQKAMEAMMDNDQLKGSKH